MKDKVDPPLGDNFRENKSLPLYDGCWSCNVGEYIPTPRFGKLAALEEKRGTPH